MGFGSASGFWRRQGGAELWTPAQIPDAIWWDIADPSTVTLDGSGRFNEATDKNGGIYNFTGNGGISNPSMSTINGLDCAFFDNQAKRINSSPNSGIGLGSLFMLWDLDSGTNGSVVRSQNGQYIAFAQNGSTQTIFNNGAGTPNIWLNGELQSWSNRGDVYTDVVGGIKILSSDNIDTSGWDITWVYFYYNTTLSYLGRLGETIWVPDSATTTERQLIEGYMSWKWAGDGSLLPIGHPYKSAPPYV